MAAKALRRVFVVGNGMTKFEKPGRFACDCHVRAPCSRSRKDFDYPDMAKEATDMALAAGSLPYTAVQQAVVGYVYGWRTSAPPPMTQYRRLHVRAACAVHGRPDRHPHLQCLARPRARP